MSDPNPSTLLLADILALRMCVASLARETLLAKGPEALARAKSEALRWASEATHPHGPYSDAVKEHCHRVVQDLFSLADGTPLAPATPDQAAVTQNASTRS